MATLSNWLATNKQPDMLPPTVARTVLNLIRTFEQRVKDLGFGNVMTEFKEHFIDTNNPHHIHIDNLLDLIITSLYAYYQKTYVPLLGKGDTIIQSKTQLETYLNNNPPLLFELMRQCQLNTKYQYVDGYGSAPWEPFYVLSDPTPIDVPHPFYMADCIAPDLILTMSNTLTRSLPESESTNITILAGVNVGSTDTTSTWSINLNYGSLNYTADGKLTFTLDESVICSVSADADETRWAVNLTATGGTLYYFFNHQLASTTFTFAVEQDTPISSFTLSHPFWDQTTDETATRHVGFYPPLDDRSIEYLLSSIY